MPLLKIIGLGGISSWDEANADARTTGEIAEAVAYMHGVLGQDWAGWKGKRHLPRRSTRASRVVRGDGHGCIG